MRLLHQHPADRVCTNTQQGVRLLSPAPIQQGVWFIAPFHALHSLLHDLGRWKQGGEWRESQRVPQLKKRTTRNIFAYRKVKIMCIASQSNLILSLWVPEQVRGLCNNKIWKSLDSFDRLYLPGLHESRLNHAITTLFCCNFVGCCRHQRNEYAKDSQQQTSE